MENTELNGERPVRTVLGSGALSWLPVLRTTRIGPDPVGLLD